MKLLFVTIMILVTGLFSQNYWQRVDTLNEAPPMWTINKFKIDKNSYLYSGHYLVGLQRSKDGGVNWEWVGQGTIPDRIQDLAVDYDGNLLITGFNSTKNQYGLFKSTDCGNTWGPLNINNKEVSSSKLYTPGDSCVYWEKYYWINSNLPVDSLYYSNDNGNSWNLCGKKFGIILAFSKMSANIFYIHTQYPGYFIYKSTDRGATWKEMAGISMLTYVTILSSHNTLYAGGYDGIYKSKVDPLIYTDWTHVVSMQTNVLADDAFGNIYAGTFGLGILMSADSGKTWTANNSGMWADSVYDMVYDAAGYMYVSTNKGLFKSTNLLSKTKNENSISKNFKLSQNYPNPFNPNTTINYSIPERANVKLTVYNSLGQVISELVNEEKPAGNFSVQFNAANLPSGVYFYSLKSGGFVECKKLILLK